MNYFWISYSTNILSFKLPKWKAHLKIFFRNHVKLLKLNEKWMTRMNVLRGWCKTYRSHFDCVVLVGKNWLISMFGHRSYFIPGPWWPATARRLSTRRGRVLLRVAPMVVTVAPASGGATLDPGVELPTKPREVFTVHLPEVWPNGVGVQHIDYYLQLHLSITVLNHDRELGNTSTSTVLSQLCLTGM